MNKGFAHYIKQAFKIATKSVFKNKNLLKSMVYFLTTAIARLTVILTGVSMLADVRQAKIAKNQHITDVPQSLSKASQRTLWTMTVAIVLEFLMYLGGLLLVSVISVGIFGVGYLIASFVSAAYFQLLCIIFAVPGLIIYAIYTIIVLTVFSPTAYVIETNPNLSAGDAVSVCISSMKNRGKTTAFLCAFIPLLIVGAILALCGGGFAFIILTLATKPYCVGLIIIWSVVSLIILCFTAPLFITVKNVALLLLFEDIALDPVNAEKRTAGINIKKISGARVDREEVSDNLDALFDDRIDEKSPDPADLVVKHKKKSKPPVKKVAPKPVNASAQTAQTQTAENKAPEESGDAVKETDLEETDDYPEDAVTSQQNGQESGEVEETPSVPTQAQGEQH